MTLTQQEIMNDIIDATTPYESGDVFIVLNHLATMIAVTNRDKGFSVSNFLRDMANQWDECHGIRH